jgi:hypothetical protein
MDTPGGEHVVTIGKKFSSAAAVACLWVGGSVLMQLIFLVVATWATRSGPGERPSVGPGNSHLWIGVLLPLAAVVGGLAAVGLLRAASGWPKLPMFKLFLQTLCAAVFSLALLPLVQILPVAAAATLLALAAASALTWREAGRGSLGTHLFPGSTRTAPETPPEQKTGPQM